MPPPHPNNSALSTAPYSRPLPLSQLSDPSLPQTLPLFSHPKVTAKVLSRSCKPHKDQYPSSKSASHTPPHAHNPDNYSAGLAWPCVSPSHPYLSPCLVPVLEQCLVAPTLKPRSRTKPPVRPGPPNTTALLGAYTLAVGSYRGGIAWVLLELACSWKCVAWGRGDGHPAATTAAATVLFGRGERVEEERSATRMKMRRGGEKMGEG